MDRLIAADPGLTRLRQAFSAAFAMATALGIEYGFAQLQGGGPAGALVPMILGGVLGLMGAMALADGGARAKAKTAVWFPVALGLGLLLGAAVAADMPVMLGVFVLVMFAAVFVRRFGPRFFFYGFMFWMGYFFASFLHATLSMLPWLVADAVVATVWVLLLSVTLLRTNPRRTLGRTLRAFGARARAVARVCAHVGQVDARRSDRWQRRVRARQNRLAETALVIEAWSAEPGALPPGWSAAALRRHLVDAQLAVDELATAAIALVGAEVRVTTQVGGIAGQVARREYQEADGAARVLLSELDRSGKRMAGAWWAARHFATAVIEFAETARRFVRVRTAGRDEEFEPVVPLMGGLLPGTAAVVGDVRPRGRWRLVARLDFTTRQAIQVAVAGGLAILAGRELSTTRYYWAVLAAFVAFAGTATRSETFLKATNRVLGTLVGLGAGIVLAHLTSGHVAWILATITVSMFCGLYLIQLSYAYMIFFVTILVSELYSVLHEFSSGLLVLRLEETAVGAAVGILVALLLTPLSTRDVVSAVQKDLLADLAALLTVAGDRLREGAAADFDIQVRTLDNRLRHLHLVAAPLTRTLLWDNSPRLARRRLTLASSCVHYGRRLGGAVRQAADAAPGLATACAALARTCTGLAESLTPPGKRHEPAEHLREHLADADAALFTGIDDAHPAHRPLTHLWHLLSELVSAGPAVAATGRIFLSGIVHGGDHASLAGATVTLVDVAGRQLGKARTDAHGGYRLATPAADTCLLLTLAPGYQARASRITFSGRPVTRDVTLTPAVEVVGTVTAAGVPVAGASVSLVAPDGTAAASGRSDAGGRFSLTGMEPGHYSLALWADDYLPVARAVTVPDGKTVREQVDLVRATRLSGRACADPGGRPVADARIVVLDARGRVVATTVTDRSGRYSVTGLAPGRYTVTASGFRAVEHPLHMSRRDGATLDFTLRHGRSEVSGASREAKRPE